MAFTSGVGAATDPTLAGLVPRRSPWRNLGLLIVAVLVLVAVGWFGVDGRPGLRSHAGGATTLTGGHVVSFAEVTPSGVLGSTISSITPPAGSRVVGAWVLEPGDPLLDTATNVVDPQHVRAQLTSGARASEELPQRLTRGRDVTLVVLIDVVDCSALPSTVPFDGVTIAHLRTGLGLTADVPVPTLESWLGDATRSGSGACPSEGSNSTSRNG